jgi:hypothetical protein
MGALPSTLSSRAKPRDLRFSGPFVEMFFDRANPGFLLRRVAGNRVRCGREDKFEGSGKP